MLERISRAKEKNIRRLIVALLAMMAMGIAANAPNFPVKAPPYKAPPPLPARYNWTGCYVGIFGGYKAGKIHHSTATTTEFSDYTAKGGLGGGDIGYAYQVDSFVLGAEDDFAFLGIKGSGFPPILPSPLMSKNAGWRRCEAVSASRLTDGFLMCTAALPGRTAPH